MGAQGSLARLPELIGLGAVEPVRALLGRMVGCHLPWLRRRARSESQGYDGRAVITSAGEAELPKLLEVLQPEAHRPAA